MHFGKAAVGARGYSNVALRFSYERVSSEFSLLQSTRPGFTDL